jgi:hypothetical protein
LIGKLCHEGIDLPSNGRVAIGIPPLHLENLEEGLFGGEDIPFEVDIPEIVSRSFHNPYFDPDFFGVGEIDFWFGELGFEITMIKIVGRQELKVILKDIFIERAGLGDDG